MLTLVLYTIYTLVGCGIIISNYIVIIDIFSDAIHLKSLCQSVYNRCIYIHVCVCNVYAHI